jgi:hypothetical protein
MAMAATFAGLGFGNAGIRIPHANACRSRAGSGEFVPEGYPEGRTDRAARDSRIATAPAFLFTFDAAPGRHLRAARILDPDASGDGPELCRAWSPR